MAQKRMWYTETTTEFKGIAYRMIYNDWDNKKFYVENPKDARWLNDMLNKLEEFVGED